MSIKSSIFKKSSIQKDIIGGDIMEKKSWYKRWWAIVLYVLFGIFILAGIFGGNNSDTSQNGKNTIDSSQKTITKSLQEMLPSRQNIPTEFTLDKPSNLTLSEIPDGFDSGIKSSATKIVGSMGTGVIVIDFQVIKFNTSEQAKSYYTTEIDKIKNDGGYSEVSISVPSRAECFSFTQDYGYQAQFATSDCVKDNIAYEVLVTSAQSIESPKKYLKDMITSLDNAINK